VELPLHIVGPDHDETLRVPIWERPQHDHVEHAEDGRARSNAKRKGQDGYGSEAGRLRECA